jgi:hypothetical protein
MDKFDLVVGFFACLKFHTPFLFMTDSNFFSEISKPNLKLKLKKILLGQFLFRRTSGFLTSGKANEKFYKFYGVPKEKMVRFPFSRGYEEILAKRVC